MSSGAWGFHRPRLGVALLAVVSLALVPASSAQTKPGTGIVQVKVTDPAGNPVADFPVTIESGRRGPANANQAAGAGGTLGGKAALGDPGRRDLAAAVLLGEQTTLKTDKDGAATFKNLDPGRYRLKTDPTDKFELSIHPVKVEAGVTAKVEIKLTPKE